jgi:membrane protein insertase Oxa1/YidC/SpoIIIJ
LSTNQTTAEKEEMMDKLKLIETQYKNDPVKRKMESKKIFRSNKRVIFAEFFDVSLQVLIALMLYRIFSTGLEGADFHLLYPGINQPSQPFNLIFLGVYDLSKPNFLLNLINSVVIFIAEAVNIANQQRLITREDKMALFVFPIIAFFFFAYMPAGKKLFVITTLLFSIAIMVVQILSFWYHRLSNKLSSVFYSKVKKEK